jgi:hypothetical protein
MNLQQIAAKHKIAEHFLNSKEDGLTIGAASIEDLIFEVKKGTIEQEQLVYQLTRLKNFLVDVKNSTF